jgi:hypothetical protein
VKACRRFILVLLFVQLILLRVPLSHAEPLPVWFGPSNWYPFVVENGIATPGRGPGARPGYVLQGDYNAMFLPGAPWDPSKIQLLVLTTIEIMRNPQAEAIARWSGEHPNIRIGLVQSMLTVGPKSSCASSGGQAYPAKGTPLSANSEGVEFHPNFETPGWNYSVMNLNAIKRWHDFGAKIDVILMDIPISAGIGKCGFSVSQTVEHLLPMVQQILGVYPSVQFSLEQGPASFTDEQWIDNSLQFFREFRSKTGVPVSYTDLDLHLSGDVRKPPAPLYSTNRVDGTINKAASRFIAAGVKVAVNLNTDPKPGETQEMVLSRMRALWRQAAASRIPFDHVSLQPFSLCNRYDWVLNNLPSGSPSALTSLLEHEP